MRRQILVKANVDWETTREQILGKNDLKQPVETDKGLLRIKPRNPGTVTALVSRYGRVQVTYHEPLTRTEALRNIEPFLAPFPGEKLRMQVEREVALYDAKLKVYEFYEEGHFLHHPFCVACMKRFLETELALENLLGVNFNPLGPIYEQIQSALSTPVFTLPQSVREIVSKALEERRAGLLKGEA